MKKDYYSVLKVVKVKPKTQVSTSINRLNMQRRLNVHLFGGLNHERHNFILMREKMLLKNTKRLS